MDITTALEAVSTELVAMGYRYSDDAPRATGEGTVYLSGYDALSESYTVDGALRVTVTAHYVTRSRGVPLKTFFVGLLRFTEELWFQIVSYQTVEEARGVREDAFDVDIRFVSKEE